MKNTVFFLALFAASCIACHKHSDYVTTITITSPVQGQSLAIGQTVTVDFTIDAGDGEVHEYEAKITNKKDNAVEWDKSAHNHDHKLNVKADVLLSPAASSNYQLEVKQINHDGAELLRTVDFVVIL